MDTSETYILQCEKAEEISLIKKRDTPSTLFTLPKFKSGDFYSFRGEVNVYEDWAYSEGAIDEEIDSGECVWLPRQDQLQEMVGDFDIHDFAFNDQYITLPEDRWAPGCDTFQTAEQLWLGRVMKEKYNKIWDGSKEDWEFLC